MISMPSAESLIARSSNSHRDFSPVASRSLELKPFNGFLSLVVLVVTGLKAAV